MERGHAPAVGEMLAFGLTHTAELGRSFRAIDVGCGNGWVVRQCRDALLLPRRRGGRCTCDDREGQAH